MPVVTYATVNGQLVEEDRGGVVTVYVPDTLGSVIQTRDAAGNQTSATWYWPYGEVRTQTGTNPSPFGFVGTWGYMTDLPERLYVRARYYRPREGRCKLVEPKPRHGTPQCEGGFHQVWIWICSGRRISNSITCCPCRSQVGESYECRPDSHPARF